MGHKFSGISGDTECNSRLLPYSTVNSFHQLNLECNDRRQTVREKSGLKDHVPQKNIMPCLPGKPGFPLSSRHTVYLPLLHGYEAMENIERTTVIREHVMELSPP